MQWLLWSPSSTIGPEVWKGCLLNSSQWSVCNCCFLKWIGSWERLLIELLFPTGQGKSVCTRVCLLSLALLILYGFCPVYLLIDFLWEYNSMAFIKGKKKNPKPLKVTGYLRLLYFPYSQKKHLINKWNQVCLAWFASCSYISPNEISVSQSVSLLESWSLFPW